MMQGKQIWSTKNIYDMGIGLSNILLILACLILVPYLLAPLFGGKFLPRAIVLYGSWIVTAYVLKYISSFAKDKIRMKKYKWYSITIWLVLSAFIWFPNYIGLFISAFILTGMLFGFNAQGKSGWQDEK
jgi:hypothetical protein